LEEFEPAHAGCHFGFGIYGLNLQIQFFNLFEAEQSTKSSATPTPAPQANKSP
jgi:hypothetical protein